MEAEILAAAAPPRPRVEPVPEYDTPLTTKEWLALVRETRLANGNSAAQKVYAQSPFAEYLRAENGPEPQSSARALTPDQEASLGGFDMTLTEEAILRHVEQSTLSGRRKTTQELAHLVNIGPQEAAECVSRLSAFDLIQRNTWHKKQWQITGHGSQLLWSLDRNRR